MEFGEKMTILKKTNSSYKYRKNTCWIGRSSNNNYKLTISVLSPLIRWSPPMHRSFMADNGRRCLSRHLFLSFLLASFLGRYLQGGLAQLAFPGDEGGDGGDRTAVYVVHVRKPEGMLHAGAEELAAWHRSFLPSHSLDSGEPRLVFSYSSAMSGFAARLTADEVEALAGKEGFLAAFPDEKLSPQTTYTPDFLRLRPDVWRAANRGDGVIIGVVDSGVNPDHVSFATGTNAAVRRRPPRKWRGYCEFYRHHTCGGKLLGARNYDAGAKAEQPLPYDTEGHGTHVAGTAAGVEVPGANVYGYANGTASGAAPGAHLAVYKAATVAEVLAAINQAIEDGVDILCIPLASHKGDLSIFLDVVAIGALAAVRKGILVVAAAGNYGPSPGTLRNDAPWIMTVGASTTDRALRASLLLSNGVELPGEALRRNASNLLDEMPLVYPSAKRGQLPAEACSQLRPAKVTGKVVLCLTGANMTTAEKAEVVAAAGGAAMVVMNSEKRGQTIAEVPDVDIPTVVLDYNTSLQLREYVAKFPRLKATISPAGTTFGNRPAPSVASFSSRGPSAANGGILKPDILAPGVNILAASHAAQSGFSIASGTSVAAAHLAGVAAIVNRTNPGWNPSMIRSAIMTTGRMGDMNGGVGVIPDEKGSAASLFAAGAGHVDPWGAADPGLVYSVEFRDYVRYLCGLGYTDVQVSVTAGFPVQCAAVGKLDAEQLNYPSIAVKLGSSPGAAAATGKSVGRTLTSVKSSVGTYKARVELPPGVAAKVSPRRLLFLGKGQRRRFALTFSIVNSTLVKAGDVIEGTLRWSSDKNVVTSPLLITIV